PHCYESFCSAKDIKLTHIKDLIKVSYVSELIHNILKVLLKRSVMNNLNHLAVEPPSDLIPEKSIKES
ncbi:MAG: hypothetical protein NUV64_01435, partial [Parcubacteria group bacterium]|nr:hypothetical protein [Parcubacteria group bacterium]MCR4342707.1 hypothetical protein [Patescibacteria group bacterium]